jgi:GPH family glycoside/pentoside/hexuronide:cation symporter
MMAISFLNQLSGGFQGISMLYYCNWVLGTYNDGITMTLVNVVGQFPMGLGIVFLTSLAKKYSKRTLILGGGLLFITGNIICLTSARNITIVLIGLFIRSIGQLPTYLIPALLADSLDHVEKVNNTRHDGFSSSIINLLAIAASGISVGVFNLCLSIFGYKTPDSGIVHLVQNNGIQNLFIFGFFGLPMIVIIFISIAMVFYRER